MSQSESPSPRKRHPWLRVLGGAAVVVALLLGGALVLREEIATRLAVSLLEDEGVPVQSLEVTRLTFDAVEVAALRLGENDEVAAETLRLRAAWKGLSPSLTALELDGLQVKLDVTGEAPLLGSLQPLLERFTAEAPVEETADGTEPQAPDRVADRPAPLPHVTLRNAFVTVETPSGPMTGSLAGEVGPGDDGVTQVQASLDMDSALGRLRAALDGTYRPDGGWQLKADLAEGTLAWQDFAVGSFGGVLQVGYRPQHGPEAYARLDLGDLAYTPVDTPPLRLATGRLIVDSDVSGAQSTTTASLSLEGDGERLSLSAEARAHPAGESLDVDVELRGEAATAGGLAQALPGLAPGLQVTAGELVAEALGTGFLLSGGVMPGTWQAFVEALPESRLEMKSEVVFSRVVLADGSEGISGHLPLNVEAYRDDLTLTLSQDAELRVEQPSRQTLQDLGLPEDVLPLVTSGLSLTLQADGKLPLKSVSTPLWPPREAALSIAARGRSDQGLVLSADVTGEARLDEHLALAAFAGDVSSRLEVARLALGGREAQGVTVELPLATRYGPEGLNLALARPGALSIRQFGRGAPLRLASPLAFAVQALNLQAAPDVASYQYSLEAREDGAGLSISRAEAAPLEFTAGALDLRLAGRFARESGHDAWLDLWLEGFDLPAYAVAAEAAEVSIELDPELRPESSRFRLGPVVQSGDSPVLAPLTVTGELRRRGAGYDIAGILGLNGGRAVADLTARYADSGEARLEAVSRLLSFAPDNLQPADLSPLLSDLEDVSGTLTAKATLAWPPDPEAESGRVTLSGLGFKSPAGQVRGLDLDLVLTRLLPPASATGQKLTIAGVDAAVPVSDVELIFALDQAPRPQLAVARAGFDLGGARWRVEPLVVDPAAPRHRLVLGTENLDLAAFFELIEVDGLSGQGRLRGKVPIIFEGEDVIVENGHFAAEGPGVLNLRIDALRSALAGSGETVEMAARALEDFHYESLTLDLDKTADNDATLRLSTLGKNPAVLEGQPFRFNINLESNLTSVLAALKQGYSLSDDALRRAWRLRE